MRYDGRGLALVTAGVGVSVGAILFLAGMGVLDAWLVGSGCGMMTLSIGLLMVVD